MLDSLDMLKWHLIFLSVCAYTISNHHDRLASNTPKAMLECSTEQHSLLTKWHCHTSLLLYNESNFLGIVVGVHSGYAYQKQLHKLDTASAQATQDFVLVLCARFLHAKHRLANPIEHLYIQV